MKSLTIETKVWNGDWQVVLNPERLRLTFELNPGNYHRRVLINNVDDLPKVKEHADRLVRIGLVHEIVVVAEHIEPALNHFNISKESLGKGFVYSSAELVGLYTCTTEFLCHYASDCWNLHISDWCSRGMDLLNSDPEISVVNPLWNGEYNMALLETISRRGVYGIGYGFSDQCYLVRTKEILGADLNLRHFASSRYPDYGGELFEKRIDSWMRTHGRFRANDLSATYFHKA
ncbi:MAG: hypothetical protein J0L72_04235 [Armatimonadetes bacterium]|nr:hypothetical protein [Armatimonadota bacterium]